MTRSGPPGTELEIIESDEDEIVPPEAEGSAAATLLTTVLALIALAPFATRAQPPGKAWYLAPINWPLFSLGIAAIAGVVLTWQLWSKWRATPDRTAFRTNARWAFSGMGRAFEYGFYFCAYLLAVAWIGFSIATLLFLEFIVWRSGLRGLKWVLSTLCVTVAVVVVFRFGIGLWFPLSPLLKLFPAWVGNSLGGFL